MGLFDGVIDSTFSQNDKGERIFYPYGPVGRGYIITRVTESRLRTFLRNYFRLILVGAIFTGTVLTRVGWPGVVGILVLMVSMLVGYEIRVRQLVRGAPRAPLVRGNGGWAQPCDGPPVRNHD